jgi:hypothetical protein
MLTHFAGWTFAVLTLLMVGVNAFFMLLFPRLWFRLPGWIRANARFTAQKHGSGPASFQVRAVGAAALLVAIVIALAIALDGGWQGR